jgi:hypothetical protein
MIGVRYFGRFGPWTNSYWDGKILTVLFSARRRCLIFFNRSSDLCENLNMYKCKNSFKCIFRYRVKDKLLDCFLTDDESDEIGHHLVNCSSETSQKLFHCYKKNSCISDSLVQNTQCNCPRLFNKNHCVKIRS